MIELRKLPDDLKIPFWPGKLENGRHVVLWPSLRSRSMLGRFTEAAALLPPERRESLLQHLGPYVLEDALVARLRGRGCELPVNGSFPARDFSLLRYAEVPGDLPELYALPVSALYLPPEDLAAVEKVQKKFPLPLASDARLRALERILYDRDLVLELEA